MDMDWESMTAEEAEALAAGMQAAECSYSKSELASMRLEQEILEAEGGHHTRLRRIKPPPCTYCGGEGGEPGREPCPVCLDGRK